MAKPADFSPTRRMDAKIKMLAEATGKISHNDHLKCFLGSNQSIVRIRVIGKKEINPGDWGWIQMEFSEPVIAEKKDRFILRRPSPAETIAGGIILDAHPVKRHKRFSENIIAHMKMLETGSNEEILLSVLQSGRFFRISELIEQSGLDENTLRNEIEKLENKRILRVGSENERNSLICTNAYWKTLVNEISAELTAFYSSHPLRFGVTKIALNKKLKLDSKVLNLVLQKLSSQGLLIEKDSEVGLAEHEIVFSKADEENAKSIIKLFNSNPYSPPGLKELSDEYGEDFVEALIVAERLTQVADDIAFLPDTYQAMQQGARDFLVNEGKMTLGQFRDLFGTSRKFALAFLEYMDKEGITIRKEDYRVLK